MRALSVLVICLIFSSQFAMAACPPGHTSVVVQLLRADQQPSVTHSLSARALINNVQLPDWQPKGTQLQFGLPGRFVSNQDIQYDIVPQITQMQDGSACYGFSKISYTYALINNQIQVASEIPTGSCGFNEVIRHETRHYTAARSVMAQWQPSFEAELKNLALRLGTLQTNDIQGTQDMMYRQIYDVINGQLTRLATETAQRNAAIDTVQEGKRAYTVCNGEIMRALSSAR